MFQILLVLCSLLVGTPVSARSDFHVGVGTHVGLNQGDAKRIEALVTDSGATSFRDDVSWSRVEERKNIIGFGGKLSDIKQMIESADRVGIKPLLVLAYGNEHHTRRGFPVEAAQREAFVRYAVAVASEFKERIAGLEIWNEWNAGTGLPTAGMRGTADSYVELLKAVYPAIKKKAPQLRVFGGAVAGLDESWIKQVVNAGGLDAMDVLSIHPYVFNHWDKKKRNPEFAIAWLDNLQRTILTPYAKKPYPVAITEIGWPTNRGPNGSTVALAAQYLERFYLSAAARSWIKGVWWYDLRDDGDDPNNQEHAFGLVAHDYSSKAAYQAFNRVASTIVHASSVTAPTTPPGVEAVCLKKPDGSEVLSLWCSTALNCSTTLDIAGSVESDGQVVSGIRVVVTPQPDYYVVTTACEQAVASMRLVR